MRPVPRSLRAVTPAARPSAPGRGKSAGAARERISVDPENARDGLVALVLAILELVRQLLLRQAVRRMESGSLSDEQVERLGLSMMRLEETLEELKTHFGLTSEDLDIDLGPLGKLF